jgi:ketosteroid isomerase-like protein
MKANVLCRLAIVALALSIVAGSDVAHSRKLEIAVEPSSKKSTQAEQNRPVAQETNKLEIGLVGANPTNDAEKEVIAALKKLLEGIANHDVEQIADCLSTDVTTFDTRTDKFLFSKDAVLDHVKKNVIGTAGSSPIKKLVVYHPFVTVKGDTAMVSFRATKEMADKQSTKLESWCAEIFEKKNGEWLVLQLKTNWEPIKTD